MTATSSTRASGLPESFYAPDFRVLVEGVVLDPVSNGHVLEIKVVMDSDDLSSADVTLNNYDDTTFDLRWSVFKQNVVNAEPNPSDFTPFRLGAHVEVQLGYIGHLVSMVHGTITTIGASFSDGAPTLNLRVMDPLHALKDSHAPSDEVTYHDMQDWEIAEQIADRHHLSFERDNDGPVHDLVVQRNMDDLTFLKERAARLDFKVFTRTDPATGADVLHFAKPTDGRKDKPIRTWALTWGSLLNGTPKPAGSVPAPSMIAFNPTISNAEQVDSITVRGWDVETKKLITYIAIAPETPAVSGPGSATGPAAVKGKQQIVINAPVKTEEEAERLAEALLAERAYRFLTASGKTIGLPDLRPGDNVEIHGVGPTFGGMYFVTKATHTLNASGFATDFDVVKTFPGQRR